jgi:hypothetical protein
MKDLWMTMLNNGKKDINNMKMKWQIQLSLNKVFNKNIWMFLNKWTLVEIYHKFGIMRQICNNNNFMENIMENIFFLKLILI